MIRRSLGRARDSVTLTDSYSGYSFMRFVNLKSEAWNAVMEMIRDVEGWFIGKVSSLNLVHRNYIRWINTDGGGD